MKNFIPKIWHAQLNHLNYEVMQKLVSVTLGIKLKDPILLEICRISMVGRQQHQLSQKLSSWQATKFLEFVYSDLERPLSAIWLRQIFYIFLFYNSTGCYYIKGIKYKSQVFEKFVKFVTQAQNQSKKKLKKYCIDFEGKFDNKLFKT